MTHQNLRLGKCRKLFFKGNLHSDKKFTSNHKSKSDLQCKIKETLLISELKPSLNENVGSEKLFLY